MSTAAWLQLAVFMALLLALACPLAWAMDAVMAGRFALGRRLEAPLWRLAGVRPDEESGWLRYAQGLLVFNGLGLLAVYALQRLQAALPLNPQRMAAIAPDSAFNTAVSFVTNTNWQGYAGESSMSHLTQMLALTVQNFLSAATGIVVALALVRGFARHSAQGIGNVWVDLTRTTLWLLLPLSLVLALVFAGQGVVQTLAPATTLQTLESEAPQTLAMGPVASQLAIKVLGTNGGGFFNANSAHPFENPTLASNWLQMLAVLLIPAALCLVFGRMVGDARQGWTILVTMSLLFVLCVVAATALEQQGNPLLTRWGVDQAASALQSGGNMEGKEARFGIATSALFAVITTAASCGAVIAMHDSFTPLGGMLPMALMQLGEVVFGGVGSGLYGMLLFAILAVFVAGLMIGRTPEYLGKKVEAHEMKLVSIAILVTPLLALLGTAVAVMTDAGRAGIQAPGPHGFSQVLYALSSAANNNGSAFAGLSANTPFYNTLLALVMWFGRFGVIVAVLALAGALAAKKRAPATEGTLPTHGPLFVALLAGVVLLVGLLNYVPALALGPVAEHLLLWPR
ncbi:potassium-transporting ATPase subunit KdpA [Verminephrobacter aporrectodeae subsp. tuberculatae]|uniref:potassium-transporting ATPase subunit KdpA n=1 Tax=Verminephrobacter aporrectodeae TaxID=1110389 RepID=UPI002237F440|nr:potassium-transporting ATPase subunit KdpA [Verminephrobacter aporrectodeae]MCW5222128.1 potassium-transporting ATPase subunit KdpA [Verminephrobacter aporrectodeae subsp. tuberculatae]MCW5291419.1 potassium-transporting ATPase subunit KdpA [Verminephrobacter aporrectodeae subsp. tuberculatae]MCW8198659.1 potassium-transporting ATPase subunit KdpA [Verminephrobacter aporrectodeae subsp. tuberculatae]